MSAAAVPAGVAGRDRGRLELGRTYALYLAYRLLDTDYRTDTFAYHMQQSGFLLGFGFRF
jgi:hypothetical protein